MYALCDVDQHAMVLSVSAMLTRLQAAGFAKITIVVDMNLKFIAHRPARQHA